MNIISIHLRSSYKPDSAPSPHPHTDPHPVRTTSQQCGQEAKKQRCWVSSAGSMLYCLIINCNFMLNYPSHEGKFPISSASLSWSGHSVCKPAGCSTHQNAHDAQVHWAERICWRRLKDAGMWASLSKVPTKGSCEDPAFTASAEAPWTGMAKGTWTANPKVHCDTAPPPLASRGAHSGHAAASAFQLSEVQNCLFFKHHLSHHLWYKTYWLIFMMLSPSERHQWEPFLFSSS